MSTINAPNIVIPPPGPKSQHWHTRANSYMTGYSSQVTQFPVVFDHGEGFGKQVVQRLSAAEPGFENIGLIGEFGIRHGRHFRFESVDRIDHRIQFFQFPLIFAAEYFG